MSRRLFAGCACAVLAGCFYPADRGRLLETRIERLADDNRKLAEQLEANQKREEQTAARLQEALDQLDKASRTTGANIGVRVDSAIQDMAAVRGQLEAGEHRVTELVARVTELEAKASAAAKAAEAKVEKVEKAEKEAPKPPEEKKAENAKDMLRLADEKAKAGEVDVARRLYTELIKRWPRDELAGEAHFSLGETYFTDGKCREALYEYGKVLQDFAQAKSAPSAYLRSSDCFRDLKMVAESKMALEELVKQHPKSDAAKTAKQRLVDLDKKAPAPAPKKGGAK